ncbi:MAG: ferredoxin-type protein NapF [Pseudomonadota bacterium]
MTDTHPGHSRSRRQLFRSLAGQGPVRRPPWSGDDFLDRCTRCAACLEVCPEGVLFNGDGGYPEIRFAEDGCTLCGECVAVCDAGVFDISRTAFPWHAAIQSHCLASADIHCQTCQDACEWRAIRFVPTLGRPPQPEVDSDACTGCGACLALCPNDAIRLIDNEEAYDSRFP